MVLEIPDDDDDDDNDNHDDDNDDDDDDDEFNQPFTYYYESLHVRGSNSITHKEDIRTGPTSHFRCFHILCVESCDGQNSALTR